MNIRRIILGVFVVFIIFLCLIEWGSLFTSPPQPLDNRPNTYDDQETDQEKQGDQEKERDEKKDKVPREKLRYVFLNEESMEKHDRREGINIQKQNAIEVLTGAYAMYKQYGYTVIIPPFTAGIGIPLNPNVFFHDIIDYEAVIKMFGIGPFFVTRIPENLSEEIRRAPYWSERRDQDLYRISWKELHRIGMKFNPEKQNDMLKAMLIYPSKAILQKVNFLKAKLEQRTGGKPYTCVHMRTEYDFKDFFRGPPAYYTIPQVVSKICSGFPELKSILYIAGDHTSLDGIRDQFSRCKQGFSFITSKYELAGDQSAMFLSDNTFLSTIDSEVDRVMCTSADSFVGNNHSSWSELILDYFLWVGRSRDVLRQVNDVSPGVRDELFSFCTSNAKQRHNLDCHYNRKVL